MTPRSALARHYWALRGATAAADLHQPLECLSRLDRRGGKPGRHEGRCTHRAALPIAGIEHVMQPYQLRRGVRRGSGRVRGARRRRRSRSASSKSGRRTSPRSSASRCRAPGGVIIPSAWLLAARRGDLPEIRRAADQRRGDLRIRAARALVRLPALRHQAGHRVHGQGAVVRATCPSPPPAVGAPIVAELTRVGRRLRARLYVFGPSDGRGRGAEESRDHRARRARRARGRGRRPLSGARARAASTAIRIVGEARSLGLIGAVEIVARKGTNERFCGKEGTAGPLVRDACIRNGLMVRAIRDSIVMCPPLIITHAEIDQLVEYPGRSLTEAQAELRTLPAAA